MEIQDFFLPYRLYGFRRNALKEKLFSELSKYNVVKTDKVIAAWTPLSWDSKHFHCKMLELKFLVPTVDASFQARSSILKRLLDDWKGFDQVAARINTFDILSAQVVESMGFFLMDTNVRYGIDLRRTSIQKFEGSNVEVDGVSYEIMPLPRHISGLSEITKVSWSKLRMVPDRFHADERLPTKLADSVYTEWLENSLTGELADIIIVAKFQGKAIGFLTLKEHADNIENICVGSIGLGGVDPLMRRKQVYFNMVSLGLRILKKGADIVETGTQLTNYGSQRAWTRSGLKQVSATYTFHKWLTSHRKRLL
jgi:hypothetical protein